MLLRHFLFFLSVFIDSIQFKYIESSSRTESCSYSHTPSRGRNDNSLRPWFYPVLFWFSSSFFCTVSFDVFLLSCMIQAYVCLHGHSYSGADVYFQAWMFFLQLSPCDWEGHNNLPVSIDFCFVFLRDTESAGPLSWKFSLSCMKNFPCVSSSIQNPFSIGSWCVVTRTNWHADQVSCFKIFSSRFFLYPRR